MDRNDLQQIRSIIAKHKRWDLIFALIGVLSLSIGALTFLPGLAVGPIVEHLTSGRLF